MFLKDHLKDTYQKASFDKNHLMVENIINIWVHRFGPDSLNELFVKNQNQNQIKYIEEDQKEENQNQINFELLENVPHEEEIDFKPKETKDSNDTEITDKGIYGSYKNKYNVANKLPLPNIKNLRKWINNEKKAS
ncbi:glycoprotein [Prochlorococcus sp. AH-716-D22]|nr:glycoprotein [Prochlorococcus sp. AH-716-D22]